ncbi:MAG: aminodeoxychorismate/anthranilate synthase component II [Candidatus Tectomicrobia bacterium]|nr:aminodeoxychorismate/anthranilate synthase component II [Candidatus Tectomicrobia bacterium]
MILMIDNYDSFTYNLVQYLCELGADVEVRRNDTLTVGDVRALDPELIVISPGPGRPERAGICVELIRTLRGRIPLFGVCLGHQAIGVAFGAKVVRAENIMHGKTSEIHHDGEGVFQGLPDPFVATRYHSLLVEPASLPPALRVSARTERGEIMGVRSGDGTVEGVQFHPESILTAQGKALLKNVLGMARRREDRAAAAP